MTAMKPVVRELGQQPTKANLMAAYTGRVRSNIHIVLCMRYSSRVELYAASVNYSLVVLSSITLSGELYFSASDFRGGVIFAYHFPLGVDTF